MAISLNSFRAFTARSQLLSAPSAKCSRQGCRRKMGGDLEDRPDSCGFRFLTATTSSAAIGTIAGAVVANWQVSVSAEMRLTSLLQSSASEYHPSPKGVSHSC